MGVKGLIPFLKRACPNVIKTLPHRFAELKGKRVVLDGTLLTQRLHFAPFPHPRRHVLGWYRIIKELQNSEVEVVCIFDGPQRSLAKQLEIERRRQVRRLTESRGAFEMDRLRRLRKLSRLWNSLKDDARSRALDTLRTLMAGTGPHSSFSSPTEATLENIEDIDLLLDRHIQLVHTHQEAYAGLAEADLAEIMLKNAGVPITSSQEPYAEPFPPDTDIDSGAPYLDIDYGRLPDAEHYLSPDAPLEDVSSRLASLYTGYRQSLPHLALLSSATPPPTATILTGSEEESTEFKEEHAMSKTQNQLTSEEGQFWDHLISDGESVPTQESMHETITNLAHKSAIMSESYERRTRLPSGKTYKESKTIIEAMGVPCIETNGPYEAEALASSMVLNGLADYVGSEDTDVLVYEAPLLRNIANRGVPLISICGKSVREALALSRESYIDFVLLLGTDFSRRIKNVGPNRALKFIRDHGSIERVLEAEKQYLPHIPISAYLEQISLARSVFETLPPIPDTLCTVQGTYDEEEVMAILRRYDLHWAVENDWDYHTALDGNYFADDPRSD